MIATNRNRSNSAWRVMAGVFMLSFSLVSCPAADQTPSPTPPSGPVTPNPTPPSPTPPNPTPPIPPTAIPPAASVRVTVEVPASMRYGAFDQDRFFTVPTGFKIAVIARMDRPRFMLLLPTGDVLISQPSSGKILLMHQNGTEYEVSDFATGLKKPHDMMLATFSGTTYLYTTESNRVTRSVYVAGDTTRRALEPIVSNLPDGNSSSALQGQYGHELKNLVINPATGQLFVSIASSTNADPADQKFNPKQGAIYEFDPRINTEATKGRLVAQGLRNVSGMDFFPGTNDLWVNVVGRDEILYPFNKDITGDGVSDLGQRVESYVDTNPPELFVKVRDGGNYGWPYCNADGYTASGLSNMPFNADYLNNPDNSVFNCATADRAVKGTPAHTTPLGLTFLQKSTVPSAYRNGAVAALRACWNCSRFVGSKVIYYPFSADGVPSDPIDLVTGWIVDPVSKDRFGSPADVIPDANGNLIITDDGSGTVYKLSPI
jgi:glucose/arabinose dehydrogenase